MYILVHARFTLALFGVFPMVPLVILLMVPLLANGTIASQWYNWLTYDIIGLPLAIGTIGTIGIVIGTNGITNGTIGKTLNDIGIPLVPLGNPEHTLYKIAFDKKV